MESDILIDYEKPLYREKIKETSVISWTQKAMDACGYPNGGCSILFCSSDKMQEINKQYRNKNYPTDVLSFSQIEGEKANYTDKLFLGDIVICFEKAIEQANKQKHSLMREIFILILHALLHLVGHDHEQDDGEMLKLQNEIFHKLIGEYV